MKFIVLHLHYKHQLLSRPPCSVYPLTCINPPAALALPAIRCQPAAPGGERLPCSRHRTSHFKDVYWPQKTMKTRCCFMDCQLYQYHYINENKTWTEAQQYCREKHTDLATVANMEGLTRLLSKSPGTMAEAWIGLYGQTNGIRKWHWSLPGVEFDVNETEWDNAEPDDHDTENCGFILESLKWGDISCNREKYFLCYNGKIVLCH
uniref:C-type lectin domain-containing protein n=1 Tax=Xiphophorus maculatus TaxID=8083 RepID=A0A3B5PY96_XIPMA